MKQMDSKLRNISHHEAFAEVQVRVGSFPTRCTFLECHRTLFLHFSVFAEGHCCLHLHENFVVTVNLLGGSGSHPSRGEVRMSTSPDGVPMCQLTDHRLVGALHIKQTLQNNSNHSNIKISIRHYQTTNIQ